MEAAQQLVSFGSLNFLTRSSTSNVRCGAGSVGSSSSCWSSSPARFLGATSLTSSRFLQGDLWSRFKSRRIEVQSIRRGHLIKVRGARQADDGVKWWEKDGGPNMRDIHSTEEFIEALASAGDKLVIVDFFATWCGSCRALFPKLCKLAEEHRDIEFLKVNFEENKPMCKRLGIKVLPYFHFYRGADGRLDAFSCSLAKLQKLKDAIELHNTQRCSLGPTLGVGDLLSTLANTTDQAAAAGSAR